MHWIACFKDILTVPPPDVLCSMANTSARRAQWVNLSHQNNQQTLLTVFHIVNDLYDEEEEEQEDELFDTLLLFAIPSELDRARLCVAFEREYIFSGGIVPAPPSYYKTHIKQNWVPTAQHLQEEGDLAEPFRAYNRKWIEHFRITYEGFQYLKNELRPLLKRTGSPIGGRTPMSVGEQLCCALWWLAQGGEYRAIATGAARSRSSIHRCVIRVCEAINKKLATKHIKFPATPEQLAAASAAFQRLGSKTRRGRVVKGLPQIIGAVDGCHIPIFRPPHSTDEYNNRKKFTSLLLQGVCDADGRFIDIFVGWSGRLHDARLFAESPIGQELLPCGPQPTALQAQMQARPVDVAGRSVPYVLIADSAYGATKYVLPAFKKSATANSARRKRFNKTHSRTRTIIERAYGRMKQCFRVLLKPQMLKVRNAVQVITACCVLHISHEFRCFTLDDQEVRNAVRLYRRQHRPLAGTSAAAAAASTVDGCDMREAYVDYVNN